MRTHARHITSAGPCGGDTAHRHFCRDDSMQLTGTNWEPRNYRKKCMWRTLRAHLPQQGIMGASGAFELALCTHLDALYGASMRLCRGHRADAEDLLQEATIRALDGFDALRDPSAARAWFFRILIRTNLNRERSHRRRAEMMAADLSDGEFERALADWSPAPMADEVAESASVRASVMHALGTLDGPLRAVVELIDIEGFRQRDAAEMLEIPEGTVASRLFRARTALGHMRPSRQAGTGMLR